VGFAVEQLVAVAGAFAVGDRAVAGGWAPADGGLALGIPVPAGTGPDHGRGRSVGSTTLDPVLRLRLLAARFSLSVLAGFLPLGWWGDLSAMVGPFGVVAVAVRVDADQEVEPLADGPFLADRIA
jgi:hypothetical protein